MLGMELARVSGQPSEGGKEGGEKSEKRLEK